VRIRSVKPDFWRDRETTGRWPADMKLLYVGLWGVADDEGRFEVDYDLLRADLDPFGSTWTAIGTVLARLVETGCVSVYESEGRTYGFIPKFKAHQHPNKPTPSRLPKPPDPLPKRSRRTPVALPPGEEGRGGEGSMVGVVKEPKPAAKKPAASGTPFSVTQRRLVATYAEVMGGEYLWQGARDAEGLKRILALNAPPDTIDEKWRVGLKGKGWASAKTVAQLASKWNDLEVDEYEARWRAAREAAERGLAEPGAGSNGGGTGAGPVEPDPDPDAAARAAVSPEIRNLLGVGR